MVLSLLSFHFNTGKIWATVKENSDYKVNFSYKKHMKHHPKQGQRAFQWLLEQLFFPRLEFKPTSWNSAEGSSRKQLLWQRENTLPTADCWSFASPLGRACCSHWAVSTVGSGITDVTASSPGLPQHTLAPPLLPAHWGWRLLTESLCKPKYSALRPSQKLAVYSRKLSTTF